MYNMDAINYYFDCQVILRLFSQFINLLWLGFLNGEKSGSVFPKAQDDDHKCHVLSTTQKNSVYSHTRVKKS